MLELVRLEKPPEIQFLPTHALHKAQGPATSPPIQPGKIRKNFQDIVFRYNTGLLGY